MPAVSVVIPIHNRLDYLAQAVSSVFEQRSAPQELIVVDDGSTDGSEKYARSLSEGFGIPGAMRIEIRCLRLPHSGRPGKARNAGAREAAGEYLAFLDSDDLWAPEKLARQVAFFEAHPDIRICHTREVWQRGQDVVSQAGQRHQRSGFIFTDSLKKCIIGPSTVMMRRELFEQLGGFREDLEIAEDYELWLRVTAQYPVGYIDEPLVIKQGGHPDQLSAKYGQIEIFRIRALLLNLEAGTFAAGQREPAARELVRKCRIYASGCDKRGRLEEARRYRELAKCFAEDA